MTNDIKIPRELADRLCKRPGKESLAVNHADILDRGAAQAELRALLAAPVVDGQEPFGVWRVPKGFPLQGMFLIWSDEYAEHVASDSVREVFDFQMLFASPPAPVAVVPEGWKLVPIEPTDDMIVAFAEAWYSKRQTIDDPDMLDAYRDMLAVAPACELNQ